MGDEQGASSTGGIDVSFTGDEQRVSPHELHEATRRAVREAGQRARGGDARDERWMAWVARRTRHGRRSEALRSRAAVERRAERRQGQTDGATRGVAGVDERALATTRREKE
jgi:hypothetical protein